MTLIYTVGRMQKKYVMALPESRYRYNVEKIGLSFYGGITFESTENEVKAVLGQMEAYDDGVLYGIKMGDYSYFSVSFHSGKIHDIMIIDGEKYF